MLRVNEGRILFENGFSISEVALEVGFYDQSHFSTVFKGTYGVSPKVCKKYLADASKESIYTSSKALVGFKTLFLFIQSKLKL